MKKFKNGRTDGLTGNEKRIRVVRKLTITHTSGDLKALIPFEPGKLQNKILNDFNIQTKI